MVVDDDESIRESVRMVLEAEGYVVLLACDGLAALRVLEQRLAATVVLTNHNMPRLDGPGLIDFILRTPALAARTMVVYMTAGNRVISPTVAFELDALHIPVLRKPFDIDDLVDVIDAAAARLAAILPNDADPGDGAQCSS
ncbi:MAG TPA: response regulator [Ktedonobacterales bacterium]